MSGLMHDPALTAPDALDVGVVLVGLLCVVGGAVLVGWALRPLVERVQGRQAAREAQRFAHLNDRGA